MRKHESLGKSLDRHEQKSISGGVAFANLFCNTTPGGAYTIVQTYGSQALCHAGRPTYCYPGGPYESCYCTGDTITVQCQP